MKFFSNEAKENTDDPDRTDADAGAVPQQRAGSPWNDTPRDADDEIADRSPDDRAVDDRSVDDRNRPEDADRPWSQAGDGSSETVPSTTTYGSDGSVVTRPDDSSSIASDSSASSPAPDSSSVASDSSVSSGGYDSDRDRVDGSDAVKDDGTFDSPTAVEPATGKPLDSDADSKGSDVAAVPVAADEPVTTPDEDKAHAADTTPVVATAAVPAAGSSGDRLFPDGDSFAERFRDIQLRFVDSPKEATAEAASLVSEAVDKLTSNLKSQRDSLTGDSDDTEKLRVELRAYRDLLNRLTSL